ncbi:MAG: diphosphomevalonate decarboxylase [Pseudomonadota bacterium]
MTTRAVAHPNIALVKYWGKSDTGSNTPATPSLSITLSGFSTATRVRPSSTGRDQVTLNGSTAADAKIDRFLQHLRNRFDLPPVEIDSENNFPTASGLASSASGFAALTLALNQEFGFGLDAAACSGWARQASASAARSLFGGFATLTGPGWEAAPLLAAEDWPLGVVVAVTSTARKAVSSTVGMEASRTTSPYFDAWTAQTPRDFTEAREAVLTRDFERLATVAERSCLQMHALMLATTPSLLYWNGATVTGMHRLRELQAEGVGVFFTIDAGPQLKAVCLPEAVDRVAETLAGVPDVVAVHRLGLGEAAAAQTEP